MECKLVICKSVASGLTRRVSANFRSSMIARACEVLFEDSISLFMGAFIIMLLFFIFYYLNYLLGIGVTCK